MENTWGPKEVAEYLGVPVQTIYQWRTKNYGPPGRRVGKHVRYLPDEVRAWFRGLSTGVA
jgi:excisionase family DNA binding protein